MFESLGDWWSSLFLNPNTVLLRRILNQQEVMVATLLEVQAGLASLVETIQAERQEVQAKLTDLSAQITALQDQIAAGGAVTPADLDGVVASIDAIKTGITQISEASA